MAKLIGIKSSSLQPEAMNRYLLLYKFQSYTNSSYLINLSINFTVLHKILHSKSKLLKLWMSYGCMG